MIGIKKIITTAVILGLQGPNLGRAGQPQNAITEGASPKALVICGNVGLPGILLRGLPGDPLTDADGRYAAQVPYGWSGKVTPVGEGCRFDPPSQEYRNLTADISAQDYTVTGLAVPRPSGLAPGAPNVLVIPTASADVEKLAETSEDMRVMLHILRDKLHEPRLIQGALIDYGDYFGDADRSAEALYLQEHGAVFVLRVDFPLSPAALPPAPEGAGSQSAADPIWQRTRQKLYSPTKPAPRGKRDLPGPALEQVKGELLQSLKHAANIRHMGPNELIILTVISQNGPSGWPSPAGVGGSYSSRGGLSFEGSSYSGAGSSFGPGGGSTYADSRTRSSGTTVGRGRPAAVPPNPAPTAAGTVLTLQAKKADIDAFAKGGLSFEQFQQRAKTFTY
ncbi:MAG: hypothetical protein M1376_04865 [Planctomycetes bacterium]|nr:hypothetical protein [Planctomycetota bacterium]